MRVSSSVLYRVLGLAPPAVNTTISRTARLLYRASAAWPPLLIVMRTVVTAVRLSRKVTWASGVRGGLLAFFVVFVMKRIEPVPWQAT